MAIVKYHNHMNEISFSKFEKKELDLFFSICQKLKEKGTKSIQLDFSELKELSSYTNKDLDVFISDLKSTYDKMLKLDFTIGNDPHNFTKFNLFNEYTVSAQTKTVTIATNEKFSYILNEINPYTKFELLEFVSLKSKYSKNIFKKLKQYTRTYESDYKTLFWEVSIEEFRRLLDISDVYKKMSQLDKWVFKPILEELPPYFKNLKIQKIKQGKSISKLKFTWLKQHESNNDVIDITITQALLDAFDKAFKNRFIKEFLTEENKHKLIASFDEKDLIRGLKYAKDNINYSFKTLSYLENSIKKGLEKPIIQATIIQATVPEEKNIVLGEQLSIKTKVTQKEYEECYQEYLKINNAKDSKQIRASWEIFVKNKFEIIFDEGVPSEEEKISDNDIQIIMSYEELKEWGGQGVVHLQLEEFASYVITNPYITNNQKIELINLLGKQPKQDLVNYTSLSELLLSKTGKPLVGGALKMRLQKISNKEKIHIKYFDTIIEPKE